MNNIQLPINTAKRLSMDVMMVNRRAHGSECPTYSTLNFLKVYTPSAGGVRGLMCFLGMPHSMHAKRKWSPRLIGMFHYSRWSFLGSRSHPRVLRAEETYFSFRWGSPCHHPTEESRAAQLHCPSDLPRKRRGRGETVPAGWPSSGASIKIIGT